MGMINSSYYTQYINLVKKYYNISTCTRTSEISFADLVNFRNYLNNIGMTANIFYDWLGMYNLEDGTFNDIIKNSLRTKENPIVKINNKYWSNSGYNPLNGLNPQANWIFIPEGYGVWLMNMIYLLNLISVV